MMTLQMYLFDDFANQFEKSLVSELEYQLPKVVVEMVRKNPQGEI